MVTVNVAPNAPAGNRLKASSAARARFEIASARVPVMLGRPLRSLTTRGVPESGRVTRTLRLTASVALLVAGVACGKTEPLSHEKAAGMIEASYAFQEPLDEDLRGLDPSFADPYLKRQFLKVKGLTTKPDGPLGMAGETATITFTWKWNQGPLAANSYTTIAKLHGNSRGWNVYEDVLKRNLRVSIAGEE